MELTFVWKESERLVRMARHISAGQDAAVLLIGGVDKRLVDGLPAWMSGNDRMSAWPAARAILGTPSLVGGFHRDPNKRVHGQGAVDDAAGDLALGVHLAQLVGIHGFRAS